jgi:diadenosine tetraphosphatase ApaH/serine/threonine PP2A family protein phosphatase
LTEIKVGRRDQRIFCTGAREVLVAIFADIHANRQAFSGCLAQARTSGADRIALLGDYVGYGADPEWVVLEVMELIDKGAVAVLGNHDNAVNNVREQLNIEAQVVIEWTRGELGVAERKFLTSLPLMRDEGDSLFVHSEASKPGKWIYVTSARDAARSITGTSADITFCGHVHRPALYCMSGTGKMTAFTPVTGVPVQLLPGRRWLAVLGSVGQPRDGNPAASYLMWNTDRREITYCRAPYDVETAAARIRKTGLPTSLADRLLVGQ